MPGGTQNFQVDLHGVVDLLSHHLYSSPRVFVRELLQNAVDAITARRALDPQAPARIALTCDGAVLTISDTGVGLSGRQVVDLLATIGRSSKRDEIGFAREEFLGQFGIGLLSAFMVADQVEVVTRPEGGETTHWVGSADGRYSLAPAASPREEVGTTVRLAPRPGSQDWFAPAMVHDLAVLFGSLLPFEVTVNGALVSDGVAPWDRARTPGERRAALVGYAQDVLGFTPFDVIDLDVPAAGLAGVAFVLPFPANPAERAVHRVYLKRMLLAESAEGLLPDWAFFVRCVVDTTQLRPTASREALYDEPALEEAREALGDRIRGWLVRLGRTRPDRLAELLRIHQLGVKALALHDDEMLRLVDRWVPFETNQGRMTLEQLRSQGRVLRFVVSVDEFRQLAAVAAAQGTTLVNAGYTYDLDLVERLPRIDPDVVVSRFDPTELTTSFEELDPDTELALRPFLAGARAALEEVGCDVVVRSFEPVGLSALYLVDRAATFAAELRQTRDQVDGLWAEVLGALDQRESSRPQLVLNHRNPLVRRLAMLSDPGITRLAIEGLYGHALMQGHHPITPADAAMVNRSFLGLIEQAVPTDDPDLEETP